jgi:hypothetical protein
METFVTYASGNKMQATTQRFFGATALALICGAPACANTFETIDLPLTALNANILAWSDGATYAPVFTAGAGMASGTVPFVFATNAAGNNVLYEHDTVDIPVGRSGVATVYTLMNTAFGAPDTQVGGLTFTFGSGESFSVNLVGPCRQRRHTFPDRLDGRSGAGTRYLHDGRDGPHRRGGGPDAAAVAMT